MDTVLVDARLHNSWDSFVAASRSGHVLQSWEWGEIKRQSGWEPLRLAVIDHGRLKAAAQVMIRTLPLGAGRLAYVPKGPVLDYDDAGLLAHVVTSLRQLAAQYRVISLKLEPEIPEPSTVARGLADLGLAPSAPVQMRSTIWVDLSPSEDELLARLKQKTRYNVRLAARKGVTVEIGTPDDLKDWYRIYADTAERDTFTIHTLPYYEHVLAKMWPRGMASILLARHDGDLLAGIILFHCGQTAQYMYGASSNSKRNLMAPYLLQWKGMCWAKERGALNYDLWGIPDRLNDTENLWGVYRHKSGYGGRIVRYIGAYDLVRSPLHHFALEKIARPLFSRAAHLTA